MTTVNPYQQIGLITPQPVPRRIVASVAGFEKTGKTHLGGTGRSPIVFVKLDTGTEGVIEKFGDTKEIYIYDIPFSRPAGLLGDGETRDWKKKWTDFNDTLQRIYALNPGTVVIDTWTEGYALARLAHFGKLSQVLSHQYGPVNDDLAAVVGLAFGAKHTTTLFIHKMGYKFASDPPQTEVKGWKEMDYMVQVNLRNSKVPAEAGVGMDTFYSQIKDCRQNPNAVGYALSGDSFSLEYLESVVLDWRP